MEHNRGNPDLLGGCIAMGKNNVCPMIN